MKPVRTARVRLALWLLATASLAAGCSSLPPPAPREASTHLADTATTTTLGRALNGADPGDGRSGLRALPDPLDAFVARVQLVRSAERSLDLQYYIWRPDTTGLLLLDELRRAAARGVHVRLLLDDNGIGGLEETLSALDAHPQIEVRLFNPYPNRGFKALGYLHDFERLNRRMHNKALIADAQAVIVGGRNIGDAYFGADRGVLFADLDVLALGAIADDAAQMFDAYWNHPLAWPVAELAGPAGRDAAWLDTRLRGDGDDAPARQAYRQAVEQSSLRQALSTGTAAREWARMQLVADPPGKAIGVVEGPRLLIHQLDTLIGGAAKSLDLVSAYFVPGEPGVELLAGYARAGARVRVVTNSLAATDVVAVHAGYAPRRAALLRAGIDLYEMKAEGGAARPRARLLPQGSGAADSLHGKVFVADRQRVFVGSFNLDPRSVRLNTEMGLVIHSPRLAAEIADGLDSQLPTTAWRLRLRAPDALAWTERTAAGEVTLEREPGAGFWRRVVATVLGWLPIEGLL